MHYTSYPIATVTVVVAKPLAAATMAHCDARPSCCLLQVVGGGGAWCAALAVLRRLPHLRLPAVRGSAC
jgi:hypothetical protein